jgi:hypothetical protein
VNVAELNWSRIRLLLIGVGLAVAIAGCSAAAASPVAAPTVAATAVVPEVVPTIEATALASAVTNGALVAAPGQKIIWGKIWNCGCHDRDGADSVAAELQVENLPSDFKARIPLGQYDYFAISFDPKVIDQNRLEKAIKTAGGKLVQGLPASATE